MSDTPFAGIILTGGTSSRMGQDKALLPIDGVPMACRVEAALREAGASRVVCVGGDLAGLAEAGLEAVPDDNPGEGPLGGLVTGLAMAAADVVAAAPCDLITPDPGTVRAVVEALLAAPEHVVAAIPVVNGVRQPLDGAYRHAALPSLAESFGSGERSVKRAIEGLLFVEVKDLDAASLADADTPADLPPFPRQ